jgi:hypothetical protein
MYLYSIFHGNLNYSSISPKIYDKIIDSCYWPILDLVKEYKFCTGIEFPINTISKIQKIDPLFVEELKKLVQKKKCEIICSGKEQVVFPLVPKDVNLQNISLGKNEMEQIFSTDIQTAYINEQLFSSSLTPLYLQTGIKNIITVSEWANKVHNINDDQKFAPKKIISKDGTLNIIWNSYISYQKFQRYINSEIDKNEYLNYLLKQSKEKQQCFPFYGSDLEIFGYKNPVLGLEGKGNEINRFKEILDLIERHNEFEFILPSEVIQKIPPKDEINLESAKFAILGKKQDKFSVSRWAVCGRDNSKSNSLCYGILKKIRILDNLGNKHESKNLNELIDCWASDYRTHANEEKFQHFNSITNVLDNKLTNSIKNEETKIFDQFKNGDIVIYNYNTENWNGIPLEIKLHFKQGLGNYFNVIIDSKIITSQIDDKKFYKDNSLRSATLIIEPNIDSKEAVNINIQFEKIKLKEAIIEKNQIGTKSVKISLLDRRGGAIQNLEFPKIDKNSLIGFLEHGTFHDTKLSPDFYSGHTVSFDRDSNKITDLIKTTTFIENKENPIRKKIYCDITLPIGHLTKIYYAYENCSRLDIKYIYEFKNYRPAFFRNGIFTIIPTSFNTEKLRYSTNNGGDLSTHLLEGGSILQDESTDPRLTSNGCLGATESFLDIGDNEKGITIFSDKSQCYSVPLINYQNTDDSFFYRISHSLAELDDTTLTWWKGRKENSFSLIGRKGDDLIENQKITNLMFSGLKYFSNNEDIHIVE